METTIGPWKISIERHWPTAAELAARYDEVAASWHGLIKRRGYLNAYRQLFARLKRDGLFDELPQGGVVLDVGIGTGAFSLALRQTIRRKLQFFGIDISEKMVKVASETFKDNCFSAQIKTGDATAIDFLSDSLDAVVSAHLIEHLPAPKAGLIEMARVLKPGAPLILSVTRPGLFGRWIQLRWSNGILTPDEMYSLLSACGFVGIEVVEYGQGWADWTSLVYIARKG